MMKTLAHSVVLTALLLAMPAAQASSISGAVVRPTPGATARAPAAAASMPAPVSQSSAPATGTVSAINVPQKRIVIDGAPYLIGEPYLVLLDKRPGANGLIELVDVRPGLKVRYRAVADGSAQRVVELWVTGAPASPSREPGR